MSETMRQMATGSKSSRPTAGVGQIWHDGSEEVIVAIDADGTVRMRGGCSYGAGFLQEIAECIGIETPAGRVMVGERRRPGTPSLEFFDVVGVRSEREIVVRYADGTVGHVLVASAARCPLMTEHASPSGPIFEASSGAPSIVAIAQAALAALRALADAITTILSEPLALRELRRREIDAALAKMQATTAERVAVMAECEHTEIDSGYVGLLLCRLRGAPGWVRPATRAAHDRAARLDEPAPRPATPPDITHTWEAWALP